MSRSERVSIMLSAGEASGDLHGGTLCLALTDLCPGVKLFGMGGSRMAAAGMEVIADPTGQAVVGASEVLGRIPGLYRAYRALARRVSRVLAVLPFEQELYEGAGVPAEFVGHPLLDVLPLDLGRDEARRRLGLDPSETVVGLLPGSRREEVKRLLPAMLTAARRLASAGAARRFVLGLAPTVDRAPVDQLLRAADADAPRVEALRGRTYEVMAAADVVLTASGTATLEAALLGAPMVVCYRVSRLTEGVVRLLARVSWISLPNILAGRPIVPEILQDEVTGQRLAAEALRLLDDPVAATAQRAAFKDLRARLGEPGVGRRAATAVLQAARLA